MNNVNNAAKLYYNRGMKYFELEEYESAVLDWIQAYELGYEQEEILSIISQCFLAPNDEEFRRNYENNQAGFTQLPYDECALDFIPVSNDRFYIFDREEKKFHGCFDLAENPIQGKVFVDESILYMNVWDIRQMLPDMEENFRNVVYVLLGELETKFASFLKLPDFTYLYLRNVLVFKNERLLCAYFSQCDRACLPRQIAPDYASGGYASLIYKAHQERLCGLAASHIKTGDWFFEGNANERKRQIGETMRTGKGTGELEQRIKEYEAQCPMDFDLYVIKAWQKWMRGDAESAYGLLRKALRKNPYHFISNEVMRILCVETERYDEVFRYDSILMLLKKSFQELPDVDTWKDVLMDLFEAQYSIFLSQGKEDRAEEYQLQIERLERLDSIAFGLDDHFYGLGTVCHVLGRTYENAFEERYAGLYVDNSMIVYFAEKPELWSGWITSKLECMAVVRTNHLQLGEEGEYLLPVLAETLAPFKIVKADGSEIICRNKGIEKFEYYRLAPASVFTSKVPMRLGAPILLKQDEKKKKLVLNIFVDGISQKVIEEENFAEIMPFTNAFFSKGVRCTNAYSAGEWTLPSVASYHTGVSTVNHMMIHNVITNTLPEDLTVLAEYFKEQGYQTAKIDGDWRSNISYGYGRGVDRILYQHQKFGMRVEQVTADVLEHMELMKETNQFIWMCAGDLHDVADGYALSPSVSADIPLENRELEGVGKTSVKQRYSANKRAAYIKQMKYIDRYLETIYHYIEQNYTDDEFVVSLFGDHGQGYLVRDEEHFLSAGRTKVGMMFRGGGYSGEECQEIISTCDFLPILCKLAGIPLKDEKIDGILPVFFGGKSEREYAITESIHPGDPYQAAVVSKEYVFYLISEGRVQYDGRFELGKYWCKLVDKMGRECLEAERTNYFFHVLMEHVGSLMIY